MATAPKNRSPLGRRLHALLAPPSHASIAVIGRQPTSPAPLVRIYRGMTAAAAREAFVADIGGVQPSATDSQCIVDAVLAVDAEMRLVP